MRRVSDSVGSDGARSMSDRRAPPEALPAPDGARRLRLARSVRALAVVAAFASIAALGACRVVPYTPPSPAERVPLVPPGESEPVPGADPNPLDAPASLEVPCSPQGRPVVETDETRGCESAPDCEIRCATEPEPPPRPKISIDATSARCLALAMYWEAKAEGSAGMEAVGHVVLNRTVHDGFPDSVCGVVFEGGEARGCQFSWYCDGRSDVPREAANWRTAERLADTFRKDDPRDITGGALFFHATSIDVPWAVPRQRTVQIGRHVFYK